jgi:allophanate hydrolase
MNSKLAENASLNKDLSISGLRAAYTNGELTPEELFSFIRSKSKHFEEHNIWIKLLSEDELKPYLDALKLLDLATAPLWGIPFALKDNIDLAGITTTAACEAFAYIPDESSTVAKKLIAAGAIPIGKANLDQFATGLNGTRSPWGACRSSFNPDYVSGGSSSGSAVSVALGMVSFSLGTDTAGSGRVPAGFNNLIGVKPTRGLLSTSGVVPACRSLDCVNIFANNVDDANSVLSVAEGFDSTDGYSRGNPYKNNYRHYGCWSGALQVGVLAAEDLRFFGDTQYEKAYEKTVEVLQAQGFNTIEINYAPFDEVACLLYEGPWVAERYLATLPLIKENPASLNETVRAIIEPGGLPRATDFFLAEYRLHKLKLECMKQLKKIDCLLTPTAGRHFTISEMHDNPIVHNSELGYYTNFVNLLDLSAVSVPTLLTEQGMPFGITVVGEAFEDRRLLSIANRIQQLFPLPMGAQTLSQPLLSQSFVSNARTIDVVVCGAHMQGLPLNWQLSERGGEFKKAMKTASVYRLYRLAEEEPSRPALVRDEANGRAIEVEVWSLPSEELGSFLAAIAQPLGLGKVELSDGNYLSGFVCAEGMRGDSEDITSCGGWRSYLAAK